MGSSLNTKSNELLDEKFYKLYTLSQGRNFLGAVLALGNGEKSVALVRDMTTLMVVVVVDTDPPGGGEPTLLGAADMVSTMDSLRKKIPGEPPTELSDIETISGALRIQTLSLSKSDSFINGSVVAQLLSNDLLTLEDLEALDGPIDNVYNVYISSNVPDEDEE